MSARPSSHATPSGVRRAPRLSPDETIAGLMTRSGRFARLDPRQPGTWPSWPRVVGAAAWAGFTAGCVWTAWRRHRG